MRRRTKKKKKTPKVNKKKHHRDKMMADGAFDGRFMERTITLKKYKKVKHKKTIKEDEHS